ncbi:MAG: TonB-dependent receptor plug domain-containing protein [Nibricoccus sp.]
MQNTPMVPTSKHRRKALLLLSTLFAAGLSAQTAVEPTSTTNAKTETFSGEDVVKLSPFEVTTEKDTGYKASNSLAGTRSNTPIKDIALNIQVFTKDLTDDLVIADHTALERYNAALVNGGADVQSDNNIQQAYNNFLFRGFIQNWGMRDGIREYDPVDAQGLARVEIVKGPAAALYGLSYAGGVMNSITKTADLTKNFGAVRLTGSDQGGWRATIDANYAGKVGESGKVAVRYNGAYAATEDKREHSKGKTHFNQTNVAWQPWTGTTLALLAEESWRQKPSGLGYYTRNAGTNPLRPDAGIGASIPLQADHPEIPWTWNWANYENHRSLETRLVRGSITQAIGDSFFITGYVQANRHQNIDSNGWDDNNNSQNAAGWDVAGWSEFGSIATGWLNPGTASEVIRKVYHWRDWSNTVHAAGLNAVYKFDIGAVKNTLTVGGAKWEERFWTNKWLQPATTTQWWDLPVRAGVSTTPPSGNAPNDFRHNTGEGGREHNQNAYQYVSWQISAIDNRLKLNAAVNRTKIENKAWPNISAADYTRPSVDVSKTSPMFGAMFDITKEISVFAVHSTSLFPTTDKNDFNQALPPEVGKSNEVGVKIELLNGKISGTISYYQIKKTGGGSHDANAVNQNKLLWDTLTVAQRMTTFGITNAQASDPNYRNLLLDRTGNLGDLVPAERESKGYEADIVFQPTKSLQIVTSYAHNTEESTKGDNKGETVGGHIKDQFSALSKYTFNEGAIKGLSLGLGFQYAGKAHQDYMRDGANRKIDRFNPATKYVELFGSYRYRAFGYSQIVQLNVKNLTKQDDFIGWKPTGNAATVATERYAVPTYARISLTWGLDF